MTQSGRPRALAPSKDDDVPALRRFVDDGRAGGVRWPKNILYLYTQVRHTRCITGDAYLATAAASFLYLKINLR